MRRALPRQKLLLNAEKRGDGSTPLDLSIHRNSNEQPENAPCDGIELSLNSPLEKQMCKKVTIDQFLLIFFSLSHGFPSSENFQCLYISRWGETEFLL